MPKFVANDKVKSRSMQILTEVVRHSDALGRSESIRKASSARRNDVNSFQFDSGLFREKYCSGVKRPGLDPAKLDALCRTQAYRPHQSHDPGCDQPQDRENSP